MRLEFGNRQSSFFNLLLLQCHPVQRGYRKFVIRHDRSGVIVDAPEGVLSYRREDDWTILFVLIG